MIRPLLLAAALLVSAALPAKALLEDHLDVFATAVADRLATLPATGGTRTESKQRKVLKKAQATLLLASTTRAGDLKIAKKASAAVQKVLAADAVLLAGMDEALDAYRLGAEEDVLACGDLLDAFPAGRTATKLGKKLLAIQNLLVKETAATTLSARAGLLAKASAKLVPLQAALDDGPPGGPCAPPTSWEDTNYGTMTALVNGAAWSSTKPEVMLIVDEESLDVIQIVITATRPDGEGGELDKIDVIFTTNEFAGTGTYSSDTSEVGPVGMRYYGEVLVFESLTGTATVTEFHFDPTDADPELAAGRLVGTFSFNGCTVWAGSDTCGAVPVTVTSGTFDVCNFNVIYW